MINIPNYISGRIIDSPHKRVLYDFDNKPIMTVSDINKLGLLSVVKTAVTTQDLIKEIPKEKIINVLKGTMSYFFDEDSKFKNVIRLTGSPSEFIYKSIGLVKGWIQDIEPFLSKSLPEGAYYHSSSPMVTILPNNAEEAALYVIAQGMLSGNASIIRPSSTGAGAYETFEFINALNKYLDKENDTSLTPLRSAVSLVNIQKDYLEALSYDNWNYIFFGDENTRRIVENQIRAECNPRKILGYGTGLSMSIVAKENKLDSLVESIIFNRGSECDSTDVIYIKDSIYSSVLLKLQEKIKKFHSGNPFDNNTIGLVHPENISFIKAELLKRGKTPNTIIKDKKELLDPMILQINEYETAIEYPGPIASVRQYHNMDHLRKLIKKDLRYNSMSKNLVTSVYSSKKEFQEILNVLNSHIVKHDIPTHDFNILLPHQGSYILRELSEAVYLDNRST